MASAFKPVHQHALLGLLFLQVDVLEVHLALLATAQYLVALASNHLLLPVHLVHLTLLVPANAKLRLGALPAIAQTAVVV